MEKNSVDKKRISITVIDVELKGTKE